MRVLITSKDFGLGREAEVEAIFRKHGAEPVYNPRTGSMSEEDLIENVNGTKADSLLVYSSSDDVSERVFANCPSLKVVARHGIGVENIDLEAAKTHSVAVRNLSNTHAHEGVADLTFGLVLSLARNIPALARSVTVGEWNRSPSVDVWGKTLGVVGFGRIGRTVARRSEGFGMDVLFFDPFVQEEEVGGARKASLETLLGESDFVCLHCNVTSENEKLIGERELGLMKPGAFLINTARAALVDTTALLEALRSGRIAGAATDVYASEPPLGDPLVESGLENLILTPHVGPYTEGVLREYDLMTAENACLSPVEVPR